MSEENIELEEVVLFEVSDEALEASSGVSTGEFSRTPYGTTAANCGDCRSY